VDVHSVLFAYACGAALLAVWLVVRFPAFGPNSIVGSIALLFGACVVASVVPAPVQWLADSDGVVGGFFALVGLVLPTLALMFWSFVRLFRAFTRLLPGLR
jgi:hypothetical protein